MVQLVNLPYLGFLHISLTIRGERGVKLKTDRAIAAIGVILIGPNFIDFAQFLLVASPIVHFIQNLVLLLEGPQILLRIIFGLAELNYSRITIGKDSYQVLINFKATALITDARLVPDLRSSCPIA